MYAPNSRNPKGYTKLDILGKGGCAVVWLMQHETTAELVAVKQFPKCKQNEVNMQSASEEVKINRCFY
jgi:serine/threonine protein kinase